MTIQREIALNLLQSVANEIDESFRSRRACSTMLARSAGDAALLLGFEQLSRRFADLLNRSKWKDFFGDLITNIRLPWFVPARLRKLSPIVEIESEYPVFTSDYAMNTIKTCHPEMLQFVAYGFGGLLENPATKRSGEDIALTQAILGRFDDALISLQRLNESRRQNEVRFVIAIELYRRDRIDEARAIQSSLADDTLSDWGAVQFALGICNRVPWKYYPYPDY